MTRLPFAPLEHQLRARCIEHTGLSSAPYPARSRTDDYTGVYGGTTVTRNPVRARLNCHPLEEDITAVGSEKRVYSLDIAADTFGVSVRTIHRWKQFGLGAIQADRAAVALNLHPLLLWGDDWANAVVRNRRTPAYTDIADSLNTEEEVA